MRSVNSVFLEGLRIKREYPEEVSQLEDNGINIYGILLFNELKRKIKECEEKGNMEKLIEIIMRKNKQTFK